MTDRDLAEAVRRAVADYNAIVDECNAKLHAANDAGFKAISGAMSGGLRVDGMGADYGRDTTFKAAHDPLRWVSVPRIRREVEV